jgi:hypothetical protein
MATFPTAGTPLGELRCQLRSTAWQDVSELPSIRPRITQSTKDRPSKILIDAAIHNGAKTRGGTKLIQTASVSVDLAHEIS